MHLEKKRYVILEKELLYRATKLKSSQHTNLKQNGDRTQSTGKLLYFSEMLIHNNCSKNSQLDTGTWNCPELKLLF